MKSPIRQAEVAERLYARLEDDLTTLEQLVGVYDGGHQHIAFTISTVLRNILTENGEAVRRRGERVFPTLRGLDDPLNLAPEAKLILTNFRSGEDDAGTTFAEVNYLPAILDWKDEKVRSLTFRDWWNRDVIFRAGAMPFGTPFGVILPPEQRVPFKERQTLTRRKFVDDVRNKFGAHIDDADIPEVLEALLKSPVYPLDFGVDTKDGPISISGGQIKVRIGAAAAMMRAIAEEVLIAYDRREAPNAAISGGAEQHH